MDDARLSHFSQAFRIYEAIQILISASSRSDRPIDLGQAMATLASDFPDARRAPEAVRQAILQAAAEAYVPVDAGLPGRVEPAARLTAWRAA